MHSTIPAAAAFPLPPETHHVRDDFGIVCADYGTPLYKGVKAAQGLAGLAACNGLIPMVSSTITRDRRGCFHGDAVVHEVYDFTADGEAALICVRRTEGTAFGVGTRARDYYLVSYAGDTDVAVMQMPKARVKKVAKGHFELGETIGALLAEMNLPALPQAA